MMFLYKIQPVRPPMLTDGPSEAESKTISEHFDYLKDLTEKGTVLLAGRTQNRDYNSFGVVIFNAESEEKARDIMNNDPAVKNRVFRAGLFPYKNSLFNPENVQ